MIKTQSILPLLLVASLSACASTTPNSNDKMGSSKTPAVSQSTEQGSVWRTDAGSTLYTFAKDAPDLSNCYGPCAEKWPPFMASEDAKPVGRFGLAARKESGQQWTLDGQPLYTWIKDQQAGDVRGHGIKNIWFVARADDAPVKVYRHQGLNVLTDADQHSLYTFDKDADGVSNCYQKCATLWPPLMADKGAIASGPFSLIERKDGGLQWTLNGKPLYRWIKDGQPGDISGDGVKGVWHLATLAM